MCIRDRCGKKESESTPSTNASSGNPLTAPVDYLGAAAKAKKLADKTVSAVGINQAIQLYQAQEGQLPKTLNDLVAKQYLPSIPPPPAGMKYDYNCLLYTSDAADERSSVDLGGRR